MKLMLFIKSLLLLTMINSFPSTSRVCINPIHNRCLTMTIGEFTRTKKTGFVKDIFDATLYAKKINNSTGIIELVDTYLSNPKSRIDKHLITSIISSFGDVGLLGRSIAMLKDMQKYGVTPNEFHYGAVIQSCRKAGQWEMSLALLERMKKSNIPRNTIIYNTIISILGDAMKYDSILEIIQDMKNENIIKDIYTYSNLITACNKCGHYEQAIILYNELENPNTIILNTVLSSCNNARIWNKTIEIFLDSEKRNIPRDTVSYSIAITAYGQLGLMEESITLFNSMSSPLSSPLSSSPTTSNNNKVTPIIRDTGVYNALITACERNGYWDVAMDLLLVQMPHQGRVAPDSRTFAATISACGRAKKWREALFVFETMKQSG